MIPTFVKCLNVYTVLHHIKQKYNILLDSQRVFKIGKNLQLLILTYLSNIWNFSYQLNFYKLMICKHGIARINVLKKIMQKKANVDIRNGHTYIDTVFTYVSQFYAFL